MKKENLSVRETSTTLHSEDPSLSTKTNVKENMTRLTASAMDVEFAGRPDQSRAKRADSFPEHASLPRGSFATQPLEMASKSSAIREESRSNHRKSVESVCTDGILQNLAISSKGPPSEQRCPATSDTEASSSRSSPRIFGLLKC